MSLLDKRYPVLWQVIGDELVVCANGRSASVKPMAGLDRALERLNRGDEIPVSDLYQLHPEVKTKGDFEDVIKALLWRLSSWRALNIRGDVGVT